jgi:hypothetical protein
LRNEVFRRRRAVGLVFGIEPAAERLGRIVEDHGEVSWRDADVGALGVLHQLPDHVGEAEHGVGRLAVGLAVQGRQRVIGAEDVAGAVDEEEVVALFHGPNR